MRLEGQITLTSAAELRKRLLEWVDSGENLELDLERADEIDVAVLQVLWAAGNEAARIGASIASRASQTAPASSIHGPIRLLRCIEYQLGRTTSAFCPRSSSLAAR